MTFIPSNRRRFLQTALAAAGALGTGLGVGSSHGDEPGVDAGPFATETRRSGRPGGWPRGPQAERDHRRWAGAPRRQPRLRVVRLRPASRPRQRGLRQGDRAGASDEELVDLREEMSMTRLRDRDERREFLDAFRARALPASSRTPARRNDPLRLLSGWRGSRTRPTCYETSSSRRSVPATWSPRRERARSAWPSPPTGCRSPSPGERARRTAGRALFHQLGVRMMHLTYNRQPLGDGAGEPNDGGLSDFGRQAIAEMNRLG